MLAGIDVSEHNSADMLVSNLPSADFVFVKATEGQTFTDSKFSVHANTARTARKLFGAYHFARPDTNVGPEDAILEARHFASVAKLGPGEVPVLDFEPYASSGSVYSCNPKTWPAWVVSFVAEARRLFGVTPWLYTNYDVASQLKAHASSAQLREISRCPLWVAEYRSSVSPSVTAALFGVSWTAHQWTSTPHDKNYFAGDAAKWKSLAVPSPATPEEPTVPDNPPTTYDEFHGISTWDLLAKMGFRRSSRGCREFQAAVNFDGGLVVDGIPGEKTRDLLKKCLRRRAQGKGDISENFSFAELACRCGGKYSDCRRFLTPRSMLRHLEAYRELLGGPVKIISGYRCPKHNKTVPGAASNSNHMTGYAVDIPDQLSLSTVKAMGRFTGIGVRAKNGKVVHVDIRPGSTWSPVTWSYNW